MSHKIDDARENLLTEGKRMLIEVGFDQLNIRKLVQCCGIAIGTFYNNFSSKEELTVEILRTDWARILESIDYVSSLEISFRDKLEKIFELVRQFFHNYSSIFIEMLTKSISPGDNSMETKRTFCDRLSILIQREMDRGSIHTNLNSDKLSYIILQNFIYMSKEDYIDFNEFYQFISLEN